MSAINPADNTTATARSAEEHDGVVVGKSTIPAPVRKTVLYVVLTTIAILMAFPFVAMMLMSLRPESVVSLSDILFANEWTLDNFRFNLRNDSMLRWILNSFIYSLVSVVFVLILCSAAGYAFAKKRFFARDKIFWLFIAMLVVPTQVTLVPLFILLVQLDGANTYWGLIAPTLANAQGVFLMRQYIMGIPDDLIEAAKLDGASEFRIFWQVVMPLTVPVQATLGIFVFLWHWNDFLWPLIVAQTNDMRTLTVGLSTLQSLVPSTNSMMAAAAISFAPSLIIFVFAQRFIVQSIATAGIKG